MDRPQGETRELTVTLTPEELEERGADLASAVRYADQEEQHLKGRKAAWREELKGLQEDVLTARAEASKLAEIVRTGNEKRDVDLTWLYALEHGWAFLTRNDTGERVQSRKLKDEERQLTIGEPPYAEPTPEELVEWLANLPVNEEQALPDGHAADVESEDRAVDPGNPEGGLGLATQEEPFEEWAAEMAEDPNDLEGAPFEDTDSGQLDGEDYGEGEKDEDPDPFADEDYDEDGEDTPVGAGDIVVPPLNPNPGIAELAAMPDEQAEALVKRSRAKR